MPFKIPGIEKSYHCPKLNCYQLDAIKDAVPIVWNFLLGKESEIEKAFGVNTTTEGLAVIISLLKEQGLLNRLLSILICPADREYWQPSDFEENQKFAGRLTPDMIGTISDAGTFTPGVVLENFFESNKSYGKVWQFFTNWIKSVALSPESVGSKDIIPKNGTG